MIYRGDRLPSELYGNAFAAEPAANLVAASSSRIQVQGCAAAKRTSVESFSRPPTSASVRSGSPTRPDGTLYIVDMYRGVIQQRADITEYLRDHIISHKLEKPTGLGRIYRVVHETTTPRYHYRSEWTVHGGAAR